MRFHTSQATLIALNISTLFLTNVSPAPIEMEKRQANFGSKLLLCLAHRFVLMDCLISGYLVPNRFGSLRWL